MSLSTGSLTISGGTFIANWKALDVAIPVGTPRISLTGGYFQTSGTVMDAGSIGISGYGSMTTIASMIPSSCYVSLDGADAVAVTDTEELNTNVYAGTIRIFPSASEVATPDSQQNAKVRAVVIDNPGPSENVPTYTTTIPAELNLGTLNKSTTTSIKQQGFEVKVADVKNLDGKQVHITISVGDDGFNLKSGNKVLPYKVFNSSQDGTALTNGGTFVDFTADGTQAGRIEVDQADITTVGSYSGTLTFNISLDDLSN